ncbi:DUF2567 domain-containing protein [Hamadaea tsunoensis]|uniref:DUF2567 domain-containing protein n=1 Tax=Hamadaea tsunoensis TaxID=53368 RepID=UPI00041536CE|nr:DUF2567 domain-containing protein [Hamadaea tsunoensis]
MTGPEEQPPRENEPDATGEQVPADSAPGDPAPTDPWAAEQPWVYPVPAEPAEPRRPLLVAAQAAAVLVVTAVFGFALGPLWQALAPNVPVLVVSDGAIYNDNQPEQFFAGDGWFLVLGLAFGIVAAVLTWVLFRRLRGPLGILVLLVGTTIGAVIAWRVGRVIGLDAYTSGLHSAAEGTHLSKPNDLRVAEATWWLPWLSGVLWVPAFGATLAMTVMAAWSRWPSLRPVPAPVYAEPDPAAGIG